VQNARQIRVNNHFFFSLGDRKTFFFGVKKACHTFEGNKTNLKKDYHLKEDNHLDDSGSLQEKSCMHCNKGNHSFAKNVACYILSYIQAKGIVV
jgi:hypothetical protein